MKRSEINRGGGNLVIRMWNATDDDRQADTPVTVSMDGVRITVPAGGAITLNPGESVTLPQRNYHTFLEQMGWRFEITGPVKLRDADLSAFTPFAITPAIPCSRRRSPTPRPIASQRSSPISTTRSGIAKWRSPGSMKSWRRRNAAACASNSHSNRAAAASNSPSPPAGASSNSTL